VQVWLIYLTAILVKLSLVRLRKVLHNFGFRKGERIIIVSVKEGINKIKKLDNTMKPRAIYQNLNFYSFESILFFHACHSKKKLRKNIDLFLKKLVSVRVLLRGKDLKRLDLEPKVLYGRILEEILLVKMNKRLSTKSQEEIEALKVFKRVKKYGKVKKSYSKKYTKI